MLDFVDLSCLEVNVKFAVENVVAMVVLNHLPCKTIKKVLGWDGAVDPNCHPINSHYRLCLGTVLDFVDLGCLEVNVKFD